MLYSEIGKNGDGRGKQTGMGGAFYCRLDKTREKFLLSFLPEKKRKEKKKRGVIPRIPCKMVL